MCPLPLRTVQWCFAALQVLRWSLLERQEQLRIPGRSRFAAPQTLAVAVAALQTREVAQRTTVAALQVVVAALRMRIRTRRQVAALQMLLRPAQMPAALQPLPHRLRILVEELWVSLAALQTSRRSQLPVLRCSPLAALQVSLPVLLRMLLPERNSRLRSLAALQKSLPALPILAAPQSSQLLLALPSTRVAALQRSHRIRQTPALHSPLLPLPLLAAALHCSAPPTR